MSESSLSSSEKIQLFFPFFSIVSADIESQLSFIFTSFSMIKSFCNISNSILILIVLDLLEL